MHYVYKSIHALFLNSQINFFSMYHVYDLIIHAFHKKYLNKTINVLQDNVLQDNVFYKAMFYKTMFYKAMFYKIMCFTRQCSIQEMYFTR